MEKKFLPILAKGEAYIDHEKSKPGRPIDYSDLPTYEEARAKILNMMTELRKEITDVPAKYRVKDIVVSMRLLVGYTAKSHYPTNLIRLSGAEDVGSKNWETVVNTPRGKQKIKSGKDVYLRLSDEAIIYFTKLLNQRQDDLTEGFKHDVRKVDDLFVRKDTRELLKAFPMDWTDGRIELVLHPMGGLEDEVKNRLFSLIRENGTNTDRVRYKDYFPGPAFASIRCDRSMLEDIARFNPIRSAHPLRFAGVSQTRGFLSAFPLPAAPSISSKSSIVVGMFDGGVNDISLVRNYVVAHDPIGTRPENDDLEHGTAVAGAILYGNLQGYGRGAVLPPPPVCIESFRVLPVSDPTDVDLYEVIDIIEEQVPKRNEIKVYNISLGPPTGAIEHDVSRFTYALDSLSERGDRLFCVAVGNDGEAFEPEMARIQSPADIINGLGIGAHTYDKKNQPIRASYSCIGEGREGCKVKPDFTAFGGCDNVPFQLVGSKGRKLYDVGTSYATPLVAAKAAELIGRCNLADPLVARALLIHSAKHPSKNHDRYLGYGVMPDTIEEILGCTQSKVTILYKQRILPTKYAKVHIPFLDNLDYKGMVDISWTIAIATKPNPNHPSDYTLNCIEEVFYPNANLYEFSSPIDKQKQVLNIEKDIDNVAELEALGWKRSRYPKSASGNQYLSEDKRRTINFKWDTVVKKKKGFRYGSIESPYLLLHAMDRGTNAKFEFINYAVVVTIDYKKYKGNAHQSTIDVYNKLETAKLRSIAEVLINT